MYLSLIHKKKRLIAGSLILAFGIVFLCDLLCDLNIIDVSLTSGSHHSHSVLTSKSVNESQHNNHAHKHSENKETRNSAGHEDDCCEEETNRFYATLIKYDTPVPNLNEVPILSISVFEILPIYTLPYYRSHSPHELKSSLSPPNSGGHIRVLLQSFLC